MRLIQRLKQWLKASSRQGAGLPALARVEQSQACLGDQTCSSVLMPMRQHSRALLLAMSLLLPVSAMAHTAAGVDINNTATADFIVSAVPVTLNSNTVVSTLERTDSNITLYKYDADASSGTQLQAATECLAAPLPDPTYLDSSTINTSVPVNVENAGFIEPGEPLFIQVDDYDQNTDAAVQDSLDVTLTATFVGDTETITLFETGLDTGVFGGFIPTVLGSTVAVNCELAIPYNASIDVSYTDGSDAADSDIASTVSLGANQLTLNKQANKATVSQGEFVAYTLGLTNDQSTATATSVTISDYLPKGFRYVDGTAKVDGVAIADPVIDETGRDLTFSVGDLAALNSLELTYVVRVGINAPEGRATNQAVAQDSLGVSSNAAFAEVGVEQEAIWRDGRVLGQVVVSDCGDDLAEDAGVGGLRIMMEDGRYAITDDKGRFHFEGLTPGSHVVKLDTASLPAYLEINDCENNSRVAQTHDSRFVDLMPGGIDRVQFQLKNKSKQGDIGILVNGALQSQQAYLTVDLSGSNLDYKNLRLTLLLPEKLSLIDDSLRLNGRTVSTPEGSSGAYTLRLGDRQGSWKDQLVFKANITDPSELIFEVSALLTFDTDTKKNQRLPVAKKKLSNSVKQTFLFHPRFDEGSIDLKEIDLERLDMVVEKLKHRTVTQIEVIGHTDSFPLSRELKQKYGNNKEMSRVRAAMVAQHFKNKLGLTDDQIVVKGMGSLQPMVQNNNEVNRALNRRVEVTVHCLKQAKVTGDDQRKQTQSVIDMAKPGDIAQLVPTFNRPEAPQLDAAWLAKQSKELAWVWPTADVSPALPSTSVMVKYPAGSELLLTLNGHPVSPLNLDSVKRGNGVNVNVWRGVDLRVGENLFVAEIRDASGKVQQSISHNLHYAGPPVRAEYLPELSNLVADGRTPMVIAVRFYDRFGQPARPGLQGAFSLESNHQAKTRLDDLQREVLNEIDYDNIGYEVVNDGIAYIVLQPTVQPGQVTMRLDLAGADDQVITPWVKPEQRDWILVGLVEGELGYNTISGHMQALDDPEEDFYQEGRVAFYAKGQIKGEWLLTVAYDSAKQTPTDRERLFEQIDPNKYYTLYGDTSEQQFDAQSSEKLYLRLEREQFFVLFGDYNTDLTVTDLARYQRALTGIQTAYQDEQFKVNAFAAETEQFKQRDEQQANGTSGPYPLSRNDMLLNSETVVLETRDRFTGQLLETETLTRYLDYSIDISDGTIVFKQPIMARDENLNPIFIIVDYEVLGSNGRALNYGGRAAINVGSEEREIELGSTLIHEEGDLGKGDLIAFDATARIDDGTQVKAEIASSTSDVNGDDQAYKVEALHEKDNLSARAWVRSQGDQFGLSQQSVTQQGVASVGADASYRLDEEMRVNAEITREENLSSSAARDNMKGEVEWTRGNTTLKGGLRVAEETTTSGETANSTLLTGDAKYHLGKYDTVLRASTELAVDKNETSQYPSRLLLGADYRLSGRALLFAEQEFAENDEYSAQVTRAGVRATPWKQAQVQSSVGERFDESGARTFATVGLIQNIPLSQHTNMSFGYDQSYSSEAADNEVSGLPLSIGDVDNYTAVNTGVSYDKDRWALTSRVEARDGDTSDQQNLFFGAYHEQAKGLGLASSLRVLNTEQENGDFTRLSDLSFALAWRPLGGKTVVLDKLSFINDETETTGEQLTSEKTINSLNLHHRFDKKNTLSMIQGLKTTQETISGASQSSTLFLLGGEWRHDLSKRFDVGVQASQLSDLDYGQSEYSLGASFGVNVERNLWASIGYNVSGFTDADFSAANATQQGIFLKLRWSVDKQDVKSIAARWSNP